MCIIQRRKKSSIYIKIDCSFIWKREGSSITPCLRHKNTFSYVYFVSCLEYFLLSKLCSYLYLLHIFPFFFDIVSYHFYVSTKNNLSSTYIVLHTVCVKQWWKRKKAKKWNILLWKYKKIIGFIRQDGTHTGSRESIELVC